MSSLPKIKKDKFRSSRKGNSKLLDIFCANCHSLLISYQKDGLGNLLRCYLDRIFWQDKEINLDSGLICPSCHNRVGTLFIYQPERRLAIRLKRGSFQKQLHLHA